MNRRIPAALDSGALPTLLRLLVTVIVLAPLPLAAQEPDPWEQMRFRTGPIAWTPTIQIKNIGVDTNVFNRPNDAQDDFTFTAGPQLDWWLRAGKLRIHGTNSADGVYFQDFSSQRGINQSHRGTVEYRLNRLRPYVGASFLDTRDRPGYEIDARARHEEVELNGGLVFTLSRRTKIDLAAFTRNYQFTGDDVFEGSWLAGVLNREAKGGRATVSYAVTPLTTILLGTEYGDETFDTASIRDNRSYRIMPGVEFAPDALLKGSARVGYRKLDMRSPTLPDYSGVVASADISYVLLGRTRLTVTANRDVQFSYDVNRPYYVINGVGGAVRYSLGRGVDIEARTGIQKLNYQRAQQTESSVADRKDTIKSYGGAIGYTTSQRTRIAINADYYQRSSPATGLEYNGLRAGLGVTYGF